MKKISKNLLMTITFAMLMFVTVASGMQDVAFGLVAGTVSFIGGATLSFIPALTVGTFNAFSWIGSSGEFVKLDGEAIMKLSKEDTPKYMKALHDYALAETAFVKELSENQQKVIDKMQGELKEFETVKKELAEMGVMIKGLKENAPVPLTSRGQQIAKQLVENMETLKLMGTKEGKGHSVVIKVAANMTSGNVSGSTINPAFSHEHRPGFILIPEKDPFIEDFVDFSLTNSKNITWTEEKNPDGDAQFTAEGGVKPLIDFDIVTDDSKAEKIAAKIKVSTEMLQDVDFLAAEIDRRLRKKHDLRREDGILNGDGISPNVLGITITAAAYIGSTVLSETIVDATNFDVIRAVITQVVNSSDGAYFPNVAFVNHFDGAAMDLAKAADGHYVMPPFVVATANGDVTIKGVRIVEKTKIPAGSFLVGDFSKSHVREYEAFIATMGFVNDDFEKNFVTILGESRIHHYIPSNEATAFVFDTFATVIADLDPDVV